MSDYLSIEWHGVDGSVWHVSGEDVEEEGVLLLPKPQRIYDAPASTFWVKGGMKQVYQGMEYTRRDPVLGFQIYGEDPDEWAQRDSDFRKSWDYDKEGYLAFITESGERRLYLRLLQEPEAYAGVVGEGFDPWIWGDSSLVITAAAEESMFIGKTVEQQFTSSSAAASFTFPVENDGDVEMWLQWTGTASKNGVKWTIPDYSWGSEEFGRPDIDAARTWPVPTLTSGEHFDAMSDPSEELVISSKDTNVWARCVGNGLLYPVPKYTPPTNVTGSLSGGSAGESIMLTYTPRYTRPWGVSRR